MKGEDCKGDEEAKSNQKHLLRDFRSFARGSWKAMDLEIIH